MFVNFYGTLVLLSIMWLLYQIGKWLADEEEIEEEPPIIVTKYKKVIEVVPKDKNK